MKLYIYDHCPYCLKARMIFGLKNIPVELHVLLNDDAETPTRMVGQKQVPILQKDDSRYMPESMDIVHYVDKLDGKPLLTGKRSPAIEEWLRKVNGYANKLLFPLLRNLTLVAGINWPSRVADYRDNMAKQTQINLLSSMAI
ncbi:glutaredoxin 2 [Escherichia coli]|nr:glutaredoxin 2 [Escherichia coli]EES0964306.1 glutaredoxin 2 [Escherichia coli]EEW0817101.1 glutaredoxin 2 [Escherichia coli]EFJ1843626.1 glutaredoxin 2 [Escherichia coli]EFM9260239.1 glutaredoxin 2 [Escherichia coli]